MDKSVQKAKEIISETLRDDGIFPNNANLPLLIYKQAILLKEGEAATVEQIFLHHQWANTWRNGIYGYQHYHSTAHEVLGIYLGEAEVQLGGPKGIITKVKPGDVIIIPAGVAHKNLGSTSNFACVGAYPPDQNFDMNYGKEDERPAADHNISEVPLPKSDPVYGSNGRLMQEWNKPKS